MFHKEHVKRNWRRAAHKIGAAEGIVILVVILGVFGVFSSFGFGGICGLSSASSCISLSGNSGYQASSHQTAPPAGGPYQAVVNAYNGLTGAALTSVSTQNVYTSLASPNRYDVSTSTANPITFSPGLYQNGGTYYVSIGKSGLTPTLTPFTPTNWQPLTGGTTYQNLGSVYAVTTPTYVLSGAWSNGTTFTTSQNYNVTSGTQSATQTIKFTLSNTAVNTGWISSWDPANQQTRNLICVANDTTTAQALTFANYAIQPISKGSALYYPNIIPDGFNYGQGTSPDGQPTTTLTRAVANGPTDINSAGISTYQPISTGPIYGGSSTFQITIGIGSLSHGSSEAVGMECYSGADITVFNGGTYHYGNFGPDATAVIQFTLTFKK